MNTENIEISIDGKPMKDNTIMIEWSGSNPIYVGWAKPGTATSSAGWKIMKITWSGSNPTEVKWASGDKTMSFIWDNRATYSYS